MEDVEVKQLVRYFPQVQFLDKVDDCPLLCSLVFGPDSAACAVLDKVVDLPVIVQVQGLVQTVHSSRSSWTRSLTCPLLYNDRCFGWTEQKTVEVPQLQRSDQGTMSLLCRSSSGSRGRCHRFSSSPEFVDLPVFIETFGFQRGYGGDSRVGIFRAPPGCPGVERQFLEPSMMKSSSSSRAPLHN